MSQRSESPFLHPLAALAAAPTLAVAQSLGDLKEAHALDPTAIAVATRDSYHRLLTRRMPL